MRHNSQGAYGCNAKSGKKTKKSQYELELPHDQVEDEYQDSKEGRANADDDENPYHDDFAVAVAD